MAPATRGTPNTRGAALRSSDPPVASSSKQTLSSKWPSSSTPPSALPGPRPLQATKVIALVNDADRRVRVSFSPNPFTKLFHSDDPLLPGKGSAAPPVSVRSYRSPVSSPVPRSDDSNVSSSSSSRPILKPIVEPIRLAKSVKEGTWSNREPARLLVTGKRPRNSPRDSMFELCDAAEDGVAAKNPMLPEDDPASDDNFASDGPMRAQRGSNDGLNSDASEEEEEIECLQPKSLVDIILDGSEDLLTLEEAYITLTLQLRETIYDMGPATAAQHLEFEAAILPIGEEAPAVVRALQRDLQRLMGKVPNSEVDTMTSPFRGVTIETTTPPGRMPPSPNSTPRKGYSAAEVLYRREAASVGAASLRFLACIFSSPRLFSRFSEADLMALLDHVLVIPRTPVLPTPSPKRTYTLAMVILAQLRLPTTLVRPSSEKIMRALEAGLNTIGTGQVVIKDPTPIKKEAFNALANLLNKYPDLFFASYQHLLPTCLRTLASPLPHMRKCASSATSAYAHTKMRLLEESNASVRVSSIDRHDWKTKRAVLTKSENWVINFLRNPTKVGGKFVLEPNGGKRTEWAAIESIFRQTVGAADEVAWACSSWAAIVTLMGESYTSSPEIQPINHIMDRSMQSSTNTIRPTLASAAWMHAVYAYLVSDCITSTTDDGRVVRSYASFSKLVNSDVSARLKNILLPMNLALDHATAASNVTRSLTSRPEFNGEKRWSWQRAEKTRRLAWLVSCAQTAPAMIYAHTVVAISHEDQTARELTRMTGIPSSDGIVVDLTPEESRMPRLDDTFDKVLMPTLKKFFGICGIDKIKNEGWEIFEAITAAPTTGPPALERVLSKRYLDGDMIGVKVTQDIVTLFEADRVLPAEIPGWGKLWVAKRLGKLLALFEEAIAGIRGINDMAEVKWVTNADGLVLLPQVLSNVWTNMLRALAICNIPDAPPTPLYACGLRAIAEQLVAIFAKDPADYMPVCLINADNQSTLSSDAIRLGVTLHLYTIAADVLGPSALGGAKIDPLPSTRSPKRSSRDCFGPPTAVGTVLGNLLRTKLLSRTLDSKSRSLFQQLVGALLDAGSTREIGTRLLGEVTNAMPWIFEDAEQTQIDVWRMLALKWTEVIDLQPSDTGSATNHTGTLLVSLLSGPFRNASATSLWYTNTAAEDLAAWNALLKVTVLRFRAKRVGSNFGVLESLAGHLDDFLRDDNNDDLTASRRSCPTTLVCLANAAAWISFVPHEHYHASHYTINENYVPQDFIELVASSLTASYKTGYAHAIGELIDNLTALFKALPSDNTADVLELVRPAIVAWMTDAERIVDDQLAEKLDALYVAILGALSSAVEAGNLSATSETLDTYIDLYAPRLSLAKSAAVPAAFQDFWKSWFQSVQLEYSDDVAGFLADVLAALPGFIIVQGLEANGSEESCYPFAENVPSQVVASQESDVEAEPAVEIEAAATIKMDMSPAASESPEPELELEVEDEPVVTATTATASKTQANTSADYDADVSQSLSKSTRSSKRKRDELIPQSSSPAPSGASIAPTSSPAEDVFGPATQTTKRRGRGRKGQRSKRQPASQTPEIELGDNTIIAETDIESLGSTPVIPAPAAAVDNTPASVERPRSSLFSSASRWLRKVPSFGGLFASEQERSREAEDSESGQGDSPVPFKKQKKMEEISVEVPVPAIVAAVEQPEAVVEKAAAPELVTRSMGKKRARTVERSASVATEVSTSTPSERATRLVTRKARAAADPTSSAKRSRRIRSGMSASAPAGAVARTRSKVLVVDDGEDELLLSAESADAARREEEAEIARNIRHSEKKETRRGAAESEIEPTQLESGIFDDAPGDRTPDSTPQRSDRGTAPSPEPESVGPAVSPFSPLRRTREQARLLTLLSEAGGHAGAVAGLDVDGVLELLSNVDRLREAATASLAAKAAEARRERRKRERKSRERE